MKVRASVGPICPKCIVVRRASKTSTIKVVRVTCENKRHKQRQG